MDWISGAVRFRLRWQQQQRRQQLQRWQQLNGDNYDDDNYNENNFDDNNFDDTQQLIWNKLVLETPPFENPARFEIKKTLALVRERIGI